MLTLNDSDLLIITNSTQLTPNVLNTIHSDLNAPQLTKLYDFAISMTLITIGETGDFEDPCCYCS
jgi:hypothetical protein